MEIIGKLIEVTTERFIEAIKKGEAFNLLVKNVLIQWFDTEDIDGDIIVENCIFDNVVFDSTALDGLVFKNCHIKGCKFRSSGFHDTQFNDCVIEKGDFLNCSLERTVWDRSEISGTALTRCSFRKAKFAGQKLQDVKFTYCDFSGVVFKSCCRIYDTEFRNPKSSFGTSFNENGLSFFDADLRRVGFVKEGRTKNPLPFPLFFSLCDIEKLHLSGMSFILEAVNSNIADLNLNGCELYNSQFIETKIMGVEWGETPCYKLEIKFKESFLFDVNFAHQDLRWVEFTDTELGDTVNLFGAILDNEDD